MLHLGPEVGLYFVSWPMCKMPTVGNFPAHSFTYNKKFAATYGKHKKITVTQAMTLSYLIFDEECNCPKDCTNGFLIKKDHEIDIVIQPTCDRLKHDLINDSSSRYVLPLPLLHFIGCAIWLLGHEALMLSLENDGYWLHYSNDSNYAATDFEGTLNTLYEEL